MTPAHVGTPHLHGLGRTFEFHERLGRGGYGDVYRVVVCSPSGVRQTVAVKLLRRVDPASQAIERLRDEAHLLAAIDHPAILKVHDLAVLGRRLGLVTEYVDGADLASLFALTPPGPRALVECLADVASGLHAAWCTPGPDGRPLALVHRDVKPGNVRVSPHGEVKLLDFGIARTSLEREATTTTDTLVGTYQYMAPERFANGCGPEADVYSLACVLVEGLTGRRFLGGLSLQQHYAAVCTPREYRPHLKAHVRELASSLPPQGRLLIAQALAWDPADRPTARELAVHLEGLGPSLSGPSRRAWCRAIPFPAPEAGELTGRTLPEGPADPGVTRTPARPRRQAVPSVDTLSLQRSAAPPRTLGTPTWVWVVLLFGLGLLASATLSMFIGVLLGQGLGP